MMFSTTKATKITKDTKPCSVQNDFVFFVTLVFFVVKVIGVFRA